MIDYNIANTFMLRAPLLSMDVLEEISGADSTPDLLRKVFSNQLVSEALFLASPELHNKTSGWLNGGELTDKIKASLLKYLIRMSSRCTPFGLFAGIATGSFGARTELRLNDVSKHKLHFRPDMQIICGMLEKAITGTEFRMKFKFYPNSSLYKLADQYRYIQYSTDDEGVRHYSLQSTARSNEMNVILKAATTGAGFHDLENILVNDGIEKEDASNYIHALIDNQVLVSEMEPRVNGNGYDEKLLLNLKNMTDLRNLSGELQTVVSDLNSNTGNSRITICRELIDKIEYSKIPYRKGAVLQADLRLSTCSCTLEEQKKDDIIKLVRVLMKLSRPDNNPLMDSFKERFLRRYDGREIPLTRVMDPEAGPGYLPEDINAGNSDLLEGIRFPQKPKTNRSFEWTNIDSFLHRKLNKALLQGCNEIELLPREIASLPEPVHDFPVSISVMLRFYAENNGEEKMQLISAGGNSALNLAGRFGYMDQDLTETMKGIAQKEQEMAGDSVVAEILHLPQQRTGNVLMRPSLYDHEIPYLAGSGKDPDHRIAVSDLMVSIRNNKVVLRSGKLNKKIIPRLSNAHNYSVGSLSIYRFLCDLQAQDSCSSLGFRWGPLEYESSFFPRVRYENSILMPAIWNLFGDDLKGIAGLKSRERQYTELQKIRDRFRLPREILICEADNELWIDLESASCRDLFIREARKNNSLHIKEYLKDFRGVVEAPDGPRANELNFFLYLAGE